MIQRTFLMCYLLKIQSYRNIAGMENRRKLEEFGSARSKKMAMQQKLP
jgi:hypothetical protein